MGVGGQHHAPAALPPRKSWYPLYRRLGRPQAQSGRVQFLVQKVRSGILKCGFNYVQCLDFISEFQLEDRPSPLCSHIVLVFEML
jgi:hypothetical protein